MEQEMLQRLVTNAVREMRLPSRSEGRGSHVLTLVDAILDAALVEEATIPCRKDLRKAILGDTPRTDRHSRTDDIAHHVIEKARAMDIERETPLPLRR